MFGKLQKLSDPDRYWWLDNSKSTFLETYCVWEYYHGRVRRGYHRSHFLLSSCDVLIRFRSSVLFLFFFFYHIQPWSAPWPSGRFWPFVGFAFCPKPLPDPPRGFIDQWKFAAVERSFWGTHIWMYGLTKMILILKLIVIDIWPGNVFVSGFHD